MTGEAGTPMWMPPEVFANKDYSDKCDMYSFALVVFEMIEGGSKTMFSHSSRPPSFPKRVISGRTEGLCVEWKQTK